MEYQVQTRDQHFLAPGPKRILALDGGGLRGIVTLGYLSRIEEILRDRHGGSPGFRLAHYFDLVAGTSTGAIIDAALALGMSVDELTRMYMELGEAVFKGSWFRKGVLRHRYSKKELVKHLQVVFDEDTALGSEKLLTGLLVVTKRLDTGSPWPLGNNPRGKYFRAGEGDSWISNGDYPLWQVVRASTAAPSYFKPERITIFEKPGRKPVIGDFVDGGVSPFNNPSLQALMYGTLEGFRVGWETGPANLLIVSVGTGRGDPGKESSRIAAGGAIKALTALMDDCGALVETMMQWMSTRHTARVIDRELGDLAGDLLAAEPGFSYVRYDLSLTQEGVDALKPGIPERTLHTLTAMDKPENMATLEELALLDAARKVDSAHFAHEFDLDMNP